MRPIYLDYNATTPIAPKVQEAMLPYIAEQFGNPLSDHVLGRAAAQAIEDARYRVAQAIGAHADEIYFTSGATESCWLAICGEARRDMFDTVLGSCVEHRAVSDHLEDGCLIACDQSGVVSASELQGVLSSSVRTVAVTHANNEIGVLQPVAAISQDLNRPGVWLHSDATQSFGKVPVSVDTLGVDMLSIASHKTYGPKGAGVLYLRRGVPIGPTDNNGATLSQGTVDVAAIAGFGYAAELAAASVEESAPRMAALRDRLLQQLREGSDEELIVWGEAAERLPNTLAIAFPGVAGDELLAACPEICATALGSGSGEAIRLSPTLRAIGADAEEARGTVRLSVGWYTTEEEIDRAVSLLLDAWERLRDR